MNDGKMSISLTPSTIHFIERGMVLHLLLVSGPMRKGYERRVSSTPSRTQATEDGSKSQFFTKVGMFMFRNCKFNHCVPIFPIKYEVKTPL